MAIPTIASVSPNSGKTAGRYTIAITGTNFEIQPLPPLTGGPSAVLPPRLRVYFDGIESSYVAVFTSTELECNPPKHAEGVVDVTIKNCDSSGTPVVGETVTLVGGYTYKRAIFGGADSDSELSRVTRELRRMLAEYIHPDVFVGTDVDYDNYIADEFLHSPRIPSLALVGPTIVEERDYAINYDPVDEATDVIHTAPKTVTIEYDIYGYTDKKSHALNMSQAVLDFFHVHKYVSIDRDVNNVGLGKVDYRLEIDFGETLIFNNRPNINNLNWFNVTCRIVGVHLSGLGGFVGDNVAARLTDPGGGLTTVLEAETLSQ